MLLASIILIFLCVGLSYGTNGTSTLYDYYSRKPVSDALLEYYEANGLTETCAIEIQPCKENERSRADGSCNNFKDPASGAFFTPLTRMLPPSYSNVYEQRKAQSGGELPLERVVRLKMLKHQKSSDKCLNNYVPGFGAFLYSDIGSTHDNANMLTKTNYCCVPERMNDYECVPNIIQDNDPVLKDTDIRCMNCTRPLTHQDFKCTKDKVPSPIKKATTPFDCSQIYNAKNKGDKVLRSFQNGELAMDEENGKFFPPNGPTASCPANVLPKETRCMENYAASTLSVTLITVWFVRLHNYIARNLAKVNPCWDDDKLFEVSRDIVIAVYNEIHVYEWSTVVQGRENLIKAGIIREHNGFRDIYDKKKSPEVTLDYTFIWRYFHVMQESRTMLYDVDGNFIEEFNTFTGTGRMGYLANNIESITQGLFRAPCHGEDGTVDYDLANFAIPGFQRSIDALAGDINKNRNFGLPPYVDYVEHFLGIKINCFEDLETAGLMSNECIQLLKSVYDHEKDIDLMAAQWCEKKVKGGKIPVITAHIMNDNLFRAIRSDKHWYERENRPYAFTIEQLQQIRTSASLAMVMCSVGDGVTEIPRQAFLIPSLENPLEPCSNIKKIDFRAWADKECNVTRCPHRSA